MFRGLACRQGDSSVVSVWDSYLEPRAILVLGAGDRLRYATCNFKHLGEHQMTQQDPVQTVLPCSQCGRTFAHSDLVQIAGNWVCGECKPAYLSRVMASGAAGASPRGWHYGGFWIRFAGVILDGIIMQIVRVPLSLLFLGAVMSPFATDRSNPAALTGAM